MMRTFGVALYTIFMIYRQLYALDIATPQIYKLDKSVQINIFPMHTGNILYK